MPKVDIKKIDRAISSGHISMQEHPAGGIFIYNYTQKCQYDGAWDETTMQCRGLILDRSGNIIARPFKKFFNLSEHDNDLLPAIPRGRFTVSEKLDGSLGILYFLDGLPYIATRGSFTSDQAIEGTKMVREVGIQHDQSKTYLFEIIYPENRVVVDYGDDRKLVLIAVVDNETGADVEFTERDKMMFETVREFPFSGAATDFVEIANRKKNFEGYVLKFDGGFRVKIKSDEYVRLHRILTGLTERRVWDIMRTGGDFSEIESRVPEEFLTWLNGVRERLSSQYESLHKTAIDIYNKSVTLGSRKLVAENISQKDRVLKSVVFAMMDGKSYEHIIWKSIKPRVEKPFKTDTQ